MKMFDGIKAKAGHKALVKEVSRASEREVQAVNIKDANSLLLLFRIEDEDSCKKMLKLVKYLKGEFGLREVLAMGYLDEDEEPDFLINRLEFSFFTRKDLNWKGIPSGTEVENVQSKQFDLLLDMTTFFSVPLRFVLHRSKAKFKIGRHNEEDLPFLDLLLKTENIDFEEYVNDVVKYLTMINPPQNG